MEYRVKFLENEYFYGGAVVNSTDMPISSGSRYDRDYTRGGGNQMMPLFLSTKGRYVWSESLFRVWVEDGALCFSGDGNFELYEGGCCLRDAYLAAMETHFPFDDTRMLGKKLPRVFFETAQYNTWMEFTYDPTEEGVLAYAKRIVEEGFTPGILMIDEGWQSHYGSWQFDLYKFPHPKEMVEKLHALGFKVMLWVTPLVTADGPDYIKCFYREFNPGGLKNLFLRTKSGEVALVKWWNGYSAILDFRKECDREYLGSRLTYLMQEYGIDGFKFDGGNVPMYHADNIVNGEAAEDHDPVALNIAWNEFGARYTYHEYKDTYLGGGKATVQRVCDRAHDWGRDGIASLVPSVILQGLFGHPFVCPDMVGGGSWLANFQPNFKVDEELFIRSAQASSLFPMMQFSWAPWRVLSEEALETVKRSAMLHKEMAKEIVALIEEAERTGEPIVRALCYNDPEGGYETVTDECMLGRNILVSPILTEGTREKDVVFPAGVWQDACGNRYEGRQTVRLAAPLDTLLWFRRVKD